MASPGGHSCHVMRTSERRRFLRALLDGAGMALCAGAGGGLSVCAFGQSQSAAGGLRESPLRGGLLQLTGIGGNVVVLGTSSGVAMVDSGSVDDEGSLAQLLAERFEGAPIEVLFNTHWHLDHTGGNEAAGRAGARIIAHENTRLWMSTEFYVDWQDRTYSPRPAAARPTETFYSSDPQPLEIAYAGARIEYGHLREAHTDGDIYVRFPDQNVVVAGGAVTVGRYPVPDYMTGGLIGGLIAATQRLIDMSDGDTLIVPAVGPAQTRAHLEAQLHMLTTVQERIVRMARQGRSVPEMLAAGITDEFDASWGENRERFVFNVYQGLWGIGA